MGKPRSADVRFAGTKASGMNAQTVDSGGLKMGDVMLVYRIMPEDPKADLEAIEQKAKEIIEEFGTYRGSSIEKVAFGLKALKATAVIPDAGGIVNDLEEKLKTIEGIQSAEAVDITLI